MALAGSHSSVTVLRVDEINIGPGPPPPSPPASVNKMGDDDDTGIIYEEPEPISYSPASPAKGVLHRASTETKTSLRMTTQPLPLSPAIPPPLVPGPSTNPTPSPAPALSRVGRRHTTSRLYQQFPRPQQQPQLFPEDTVMLGDAATALASDIEIQTEQIRRERRAKEIEQQRRAEAEAALTRTDTRGTRGTKDDDDKPLVGNLIGEDHVNYVLMYNMLTGIRIGVSRCQAKIKRELTDEDFTARHKFSFDM